jgi:hypothetical protein
MAEVVKKYPKKLRGREVLMVDEQIARWRRELKKKGMSVGRHSAKNLADSRKGAARAKERKKLKAGKINFFGLDEE